MNRSVHPSRRGVVVAALLAALVLCMAVLAPAAGAQGEPEAAIMPGQTVTFRQTVPINLVFVGYEPGQVDPAAMLPLLPATYKPLVRYPAFYGVPSRDLGLHFDFTYNVKWANQGFEDDFFGYLSDIGVPGDPTIFQMGYNEQVNNVLDITGSVLTIDGPSAEWWLTSNARRLDLDVSRGYTIFFVNWFSRPDFQFHVYNKTDEPDPDTGHVFGNDDWYGKNIAWGGSHGRAWFYDLSAGPEWNTSNWVVDATDLNGDGVEEYRMPPIWEYTAGGYRAPEQLSADLALVTRFTAINLLFTTSPLYDPLVTAPGPGGDRVVHVEMFEDDARASGLDWFQADTTADAYAMFQPYYDWQVVVEDNDHIDRGARQALRIANGLTERPGCWEPFGTPDAELFCYFDANYDRYVPEYGPQDDVTAMFGFNTTNKRMGYNLGLLGYADSNYVDGTQSYVFMFDYPDVRDAGFGFTTTAIHEGGHHYGMSHPHDGYDSEFALDYSPGGEFFFAWVGDASNTVMSYLGLSNTFGEFDQDNMYRYEFAGYLNWVNEMADDVAAHPDAASVAAHTRQAAALYREADRKFDRWDYLGAATAARGAYEAMATAAQTLGLDLPSAAPQFRLAPNRPFEPWMDFIREP